MSSGQELLVVETASTGVLIVGDIGNLSLPLGDSLQKAGSSVWLLSFAPPSLVDNGQNLLTFALALKALDDSLIDYVYCFASSGLDSHRGEIESLLDRVQASGAKLILVGDSAAESGLFSVLKRKSSELSLECRIALVSDIYGPGVADNMGISDLVSQAVWKKRVVVPGDGIDLCRPTHLKDVVSGLLRLTFVPYPTRTSLYLCSPDEVSVLTLVHAIRSILDEKIDVVFGEGITKKQVVHDWECELQAQEEIGWQPAVSLKEGLRELVKWHQSHPPKVSSPSLDNNLDRVTHLTDLHSKKEELAPVVSLRKPYNNLMSRLGKATQQKPPEFVKLSPVNRPGGVQPLADSNPASRRSLTRPVRLVGVTVAFYLVTLFVSAGLIVLGASSIKAKLGVGDYVAVHRAVQYVTLASQYLRWPLRLLVALPGANNIQPLREGVQVLEQVENIEKVFNSVERVLGSSEAVLDHLMNRQSSNVRQSLESSKTELESVYQQLSLIGGSLPPEPSFLPYSYQEPYRRYRDLLSLSRKKVGELKSLLVAMPEVMGLDAKRKYLVLLQNNMELRPTGGFIGSFALVSLENGHLTDIQVHDVYSADGQLKGHVEPPSALKTHLGEANWWLRDSNWDPDFTRSAERAEWFLDKEMDVSVDGVIAVNLYTIKSLLAALGPVKLTDFNEEINADNLFERAEYHSEVNFFPGSTQKKEFLATLTDNMFIRFQESDLLTTLKVGSALLDSLGERQTLLAFHPPFVRQLVSQLGWSGEVRREPCPQLGSGEASCYQDSLYIVDANVGINKANYFLKRKINLDVSINTDESIQSRLILSYHNSAKSGAWPAGNYKSYQRLYLPSGVKLHSVKINGIALPSDKITVAYREGRIELAYLVEVKIDSSTTVEVEYLHPGKLSDYNNLYSLYVQKQSGTGAEPLDVMVAYPLFLEPKVLAPTAALESQSALFSLDTQTDRRVVIQF